MTDPTPLTPESVARLFHEAYERLAPSHGYETRKASAVPWDEVPEPNKSLMVAVAGEVLAATVRRPTTPDEGPNHAAWEQFDAVMRSLAETMDDGPMVTNAAGVEFLDALARRGYEVRPHAAAIEAAVTARVLADVAALRDAAQAYIDWRDLRLAQWKAVETCGHSDPFCPEMLVIRDTPMDKDDQMDEAIRQSLAHLTGGTDR